MNTAVIKGSLTLGAADFSRKALLAVTVLICARFLSTSAFGDYIFLLSYYQIFAVLGGAGFANSLLRSVAQANQSGRRVAIAALIARSVYMLPTAVVMYVAIWVMKLSTQYLAFMPLLVIMMIVRGAAENVSYILQGKEDQIACAKIGVTQAFITLAVTIAVCVTTKDISILVGAHIIGGVISALYGFVLVQGTLERSSESLLQLTRTLLRESHWLNAGAFVASVYNRVDVLLLRRILTSDAVAIYAAPYRVLDLTQIIPSSLIATILPSLCRKQKMPSTDVKTAIRFLMVLAFLLIAVVTVLGPSMTVLIFGRSYEKSIAVLEVLIWATVPMYWNFMLNASLIAASFDRAILYAAAFGLATNVGLNILLIPRFGYSACAPVTLATELVILAANLRLASKTGIDVWPQNLGRLAMSAICLTGFSVLWNRPGISPVVSLFLLVLAMAALPLFRRDFSAVQRAPSAAVATRAS